MHLGHIFFTGPRQNFFFTVPFPSLNRWKPPRLQMALWSQLERGVNKEPMGNLTKRFVYISLITFQMFKKISVFTSLVWHHACGTDNKRYNLADIMYLILWKSAKFGLETFFRVILQFLLFTF